ncbi:carbonic anhydrase [Oscillatoria sp. FACHB-1407]|uniref:carbonic anhydrase n=1 Tax=Oscillatoria sp. FACHB-1407 TaxID=2692847 RepID=UPI001682DC74|nr:carbonic anhydrase [Oscillatoria sp. FACHB-1407]MBD2465790.1 carbonic anhydrase [Oscillatoria sp. FACHB-1407]
MNFNKDSIQRRDFLRMGTASLLGLSGATSILGRINPAHAAELETDPVLDPNAALRRLLDGNQRFMQHHPQYPDQSQARVQAVAQAQHPFATVLSCADSRVPAELIFDQGIGNIFDVRIAGNIATPEALGSIEYAVVLLGTPLLMVLGHERCGAVTAAVQNEALPGEIGSFVKAILPAVERVKGKSGDMVENAVVANVHYQIDQLKRSPLLMERVKSGKLKIVGGRYDLDSGRVTTVI